MNALHSSSFFPTINTFTRITQSSKSIMDNIITNIRSPKLESGVILSDVSDHFPIVLFHALSDRPSLPRCKLKTRVINEIALWCFGEQLQTKTCNNVYICTDASTAYDILSQEITNSVWRVIPEKSVRCNTTSQSPWLSKAILNSINHKNKLYK